MFKNKKEVDAILLKNEFNYYEDWPYGPMYSWLSHNDINSLKLMGNIKGYWIILSKHNSGDKIEINLGETDNATTIINLRNILLELKVKC